MYCFHDTCKSEATFTTPPAMGTQVTTSPIKSPWKRMYIELRTLCFGLPCSKLSPIRIATQVPMIVFGFYVQNAQQLKARHNPDSVACVPLHA